MMHSYVSSHIVLDIECILPAATIYQELGTHKTACEFLNTSHVSLVTYFWYI
jgi:hypothetical protein